MAETPWVVLGRAVRAEHAAAAAAPAFTLSVATPPRVTILAASRGAHPDPDHPDGHPSIIAAGPLYLLVHFSFAPPIGTYFRNRSHPRNPQFVLVRDFDTDDGQTTVHAERVRIPDPGCNFVSTSVGLVSNCAGDYTILHLEVDSTAGSYIPFTLDFIGSDSDKWEWSSTYPESHLSVEEKQELQARKWAPHGAVSTDDTLWWFDLRWGIFSADISDPVTGLDTKLLFHRLPDGHAVDEMTPLMFDQRCIAASQSKLRYVEITREGGDDENDIETGTLSMWTRIHNDAGPDGYGWQWRHDYAVSFEEIWDDDSYKATGLPRIVPAIAFVSPLDPKFVYFTLMENHLLGVNVHQRSVVQVQHEAYDGLVNNANLEPAGRYVLPWVLPPGLVVPSPTGFKLAGWYPYNQEPTVT